MTLLNYSASKTLTKFHADDSFVRVIIGPLGSGKSVGSAWEVYIRALKQEPNDMGIRKSRWVIVRNTLPQLETTTMNTWRDWFGEKIFEGARISGKLPFKQIIQHPLNDGTSVELEVIFLALDTEEDVKKLLSLECTGIWFNEMREIDEKIFEAATGRVGRYPRKADGGCTWHGIIGDTNPPDDGHWLYKMVEETRPNNVVCYHQPSGLSTHAENKENLPKGYYENMAVGKAQEWVNVYVHGKYGYVQDGKPIYGDTWNDDIHFTKEDIAIIPSRRLIGGIDCSGRTPAAIILQSTPMGVTQAIWEFCAEDVGAVTFSRLLRREVALEFPNSNIRWYGDPAGGYKSQNDERTYFEILRGEGINVFPAQGYRPAERIEAVSSLLSRMVVGKPAMVVGPRCKMLRKGFNGGYRYKQIGSAGRKRFLPDPEKNEYSHIHDALGYAASSTGELSIMKNRRTGEAETGQYDTNWKSY